MKASLLWIDLEMTGLDPSIDRIIEIGAVATDWDFNEIARYEAAVKVDADLIKQRMIGDFWDKNSVSRDQLITSSAEAQPADVVEQELLTFLGNNFDLDKPIYLAGNSIHQDRKFIEREWPLLDKQLHYRMLDVSAWKLVFEHKLNKKFTKPEAHRAISDIEGSIAELKYYLKRVKS